MCVWPELRGAVYRFRIGGARKFFVESKELSVNVNVERLECSAHGEALGERRLFRSSSLAMCGREGLTSRPPNELH